MMVHVIRYSRISLRSSGKEPGMRLGDMFSQASLYTLNDYVMYTDILSGGFLIWPS